MYLTLQEAAEYVSIGTGRLITPEALLRLGVNGRLLICAAFASCTMYNSLKGESEAIGPSLLVLPPRHLMEIETEGSARIQLAFGLDKTPYHPHKTRAREQLRVSLRHLDDFIRGLVNPVAENTNHSTSGSMDMTTSVQAGQVNENTDKATEESTATRCSMYQRPGITKGQVRMAFGDLVKNINFSKTLAEVPKWLEDARVSKGTQGGRHKTMWCPVLLAVALHERQHATRRQLNNAFFDHKFLMPWWEEWREQSEDLS